ncbi:hypothetical protein D3C71_2079330 [compost metagenome]
MLKPVTRLQNMWTRCNQRQDNREPEDASEKANNERMHFASEETDHRSVRSRQRRSQGYVA